jgi:hypothetical protein
MAEALLRAWGAPAVVSAVDIDASTGIVTKSENTTIDSVTFKQTQAPASLEWIENDQALPMPVEMDDETIGLALRHSDFMQALNRETLKVTGLAVGRYSLQIDGEAIGAFDAGELTDGIELSAMKTPMSRQAQTVLALTYRRNHLRFARMMMVDNALKEYHPAKLQEAVDALESLEQEVLALQRAAALPKPHRYRLEPRRSLRLVVV